MQKEVETVQGSIQTSRELPGERTRLLVSSNPSAPRTINDEIDDRKRSGRSF